MKYADKINARHTTVLGASELEQGRCTVRDMQTGARETVALNALVEWGKGTAPLP
jgi:histidyl-tRNA synthetase